MSREIVAALEEPYQRSWALLAQYMDICPENIWAETNGGWPVWQQVAHAIAVLNFFILEKDDLEIDRVGVTDSITDQDYINSGTGVWLNLPLEKSFQAVHENNLTKVDPITGKVLKRADGKVIKPASYIPVDLHSVVESHDRGE